MGLIITNQKFISSDLAKISKSDDDTSSISKTKCHMSLNYQREIIQSSELLMLKYNIKVAI